jgi:prepilin-type N-terminal cleavage/methylation domain-containing protein
MSSLPRSPRPEPGPPVANGFSLVELVIAVALLAGSLLVGVLSGQSNLLTMTRNLNLSSQESLIEQDIATIRSMAENVPPPASAPDDPPGPSDAIANFTQACQDGRLTAPLLALINASPLPTDLDLQRNAELADAFPPAGAQTHLLRIRYSYIRPTADPNPTGEFPPIDRDVLILPTVAAWCP